MLQKYALILCILFVTHTPLISGIENPKFKFNVSTHTIKQGDALKADLYSNIPIKNQYMKLGNRRLKLFKIDSPAHLYHYRSYIGIPRSMPVGKHNIQFKFGTHTGAIYTKTIPINVIDAKFPKTRVNLPPKKQKIGGNITQLRKESAKLSQYFRMTTSTPIFSAKFVLPTDGRISSHFGSYRIYNTKNISRKHSGVDIANVIGTPIYASNHGIVVLSEDLQSHGKTIMINHGLGIISVYNHLDKRLVDVGQIVKQRDIIGLMGETGIATGPHLHWGMSVQNTRVDPIQWIESNSLY